MKNFAVATLALLFTAASAQSYYQVKFPSLKNNFTMDYAIIGSNVRINLTATAIDTSAWVNKSGVWFGIGYGNNQMKNIDYNMCLFSWTNKTTDAFSCYDNSFDAVRAPRNASADSQDLTNVTTLTANKATGTYKVSFLRPLSPKDVSTGLDYAINTTAATKMIWGLGQVDPATGYPNPHEEGYNGAIELFFANGTNMVISDEDEATSFAGFFSLKTIQIAALFSAVFFFMV
jgi:DOMON domain